MVRGHLLALAGATVRDTSAHRSTPTRWCCSCPDAGLDPPRVEGIARDLAARLAADPVLRARLDAGLDLAVAGSAEQVVERGVDELR